MGTRRLQRDTAASSVPALAGDVRRAPARPPHLAPRGSRRVDVSQEQWGACEWLEDLRAGVTRSSRRLARQSSPEREAGALQRITGPRARARDFGARCDATIDISRSAGLLVRSEWVR